MVLVVCITHSADLSIMAPPRLLCVWSADVPKLLSTCNCRAFTDVTEVTQNTNLGRDKKVRATNLESGWLAGRLEGITGIGPRAIVNSQPLHYLPTSDSGRPHSADAHSCEPTYQSWSGAPFRPVQLFQRQSPLSVGFPLSPMPSPRSLYMIQKTVHKINVCAFALDMSCFADRSEHSDLRRSRSWLVVCIIPRSNAHDFESAHRYVQFLTRRQ